MSMIPNDSMQATLILIFTSQPPPKYNDTNPTRITFNLQLHDCQQGGLLPELRPWSSPRQLGYC
jgi:hypothetical protein